MDVTRSNFDYCLSLFSKIIEKSEFIAFDAEFTGVSLGANDQGSNDDTLSERYLKLSRSITLFSVPQLGISLFVKEENGYVAYPFNFYIFPRSSPVKYEKTFACEIRSIEFLCQHKFDFAKWIYEGIGYTSIEEEKDYLCRTPGKDRQPIELDEEGKNFLDEMYALIDDWLQNGTTPSLNLPPCDAFRRRIIYEGAQIKYNGFLYLEGQVTEDKKEKFIKITKMTEEQRGKEKGSQEYKNGVIEEARGFRRIIDMIISSGKPLVGHNMFLDILHIHSKFIGRLPATFPDFKTKIKNTFTKIYDTKYILNAHPDLKKIYEGKTGLGDAFQTSKSPQLPSFEIKMAPEISDSFESSDKFHDAGFDSYCTGTIFSKILTYLKEKEQPISDFMNKIMVGRSSYVFQIDSDDMEIEIQSTPVKESGAVLVTNIPPNWKYDELNAEFAGKGFPSVYIRWKDDTSAYVAIQNVSSSQIVESMSSSNLKCEESTFKRNTPNRKRKREENEN